MPRRFRCNVARFQEPAAGSIITDGRWTALARETNFSGVIGDLAGTTLSRKRHGPIYNRAEPVARIITATSGPTSPFVITRPPTKVARRPASGRVNHLYSRLSSSQRFRFPCSISFPSISSLLEHVSDADFIGNAATMEYAS